MKRQRWFSLMMSLVLLLSLVPAPAFADSGEWQFNFFGGNTSSSKNPNPTTDPDGSLIMSASGGKISTGEEGISFYYQTLSLPEDGNFELHAKAKVNSFNADGQNTPGQKSFGLMIRGNIVNGDTPQTSNYVAVGGFGSTSNSANTMQAFYKQGATTTTSGTGTQTKLAMPQGVNPPVPGEEYDLSIKKIGDAYVVSINGQSQTIAPGSLFKDQIYAGLYVSRDAVIAFSDYELKVDSRAPEKLQVSSSAMKTDYLVGESLDTTGLKVTAVYPDKTEAVLTSDDYVISGFDSSNAGTNTLTIHFNGATAEIALHVIALTVTEMDIQYYPAQTVYYTGDTFDPSGFEVLASYSNGKKEKLEADQYTFSIPGAEATDAGFVFNNPGTYTVTVSSVITPAMTASFDVTVKDASVTGLEIKQLPTKTAYFIGETLDLDGLVVYAKYSDNSSVRLLKNEYTVTGLDTSSAGEKYVTLTYKGKTVDIPLTVRVKQPTGIEVTRYPKTTYTVGEAFDAAGLEVSTVYDSGDKEALSGGQYSVDTAAYDSSRAGTYALSIVPADTGLAPISLSITVREAKEYAWKSIRFGQSTSDAKNTVTVNPDGSVKLEAKDGGGKVTGDHDGISFYYTELDASKDNFVLSADITVTEFAKDSYDGQESFGIMARDVNGTAKDSSVFASNIAAVGGFSGGTTKPIGTQLFVRTGVAKPDGTGSKGVQSIMLKNERPTANNTYPKAPYRLTLSKTNSGYTGKLNDGNEEIFFTPDILNVQDSKMYVGFFTARLATIEVSNISLTVTAAESDAPKVEPNPQPATPTFDIVSLDKTSNADYALLLSSNVDGTVTVKQGQQVIAQDAAITGGKTLKIPATLARNSNTNFSVTYLPNDTEYLTSYDKIVRNFTVTMKTYADNGDIYVTPNGSDSGLGTAESPLDLDTAVQFVKPGQKIILADGSYVRNAKLEIKKYNDGTAEAMKYLVAAPGAKPVIDFDKKSEGVVLSGNYWHIKGIDVARSADNTKGFTVGGSHNIVEGSRFYENGDTGLQISRTDNSDDIADWPSYNLILNSESFDNQDPSNNNADGFAAKLTAGVGNIFRGCISHNNIDDGWDLYTKAGSGAIGPVTIENSIAYHNGTLTNGTVGSGDKNGFKLGGEGIHVPHLIRNSIAFGNGAYGFTSNSNPGVKAENNISFNNAGANLNFSTYTGIQTDFEINGFVSYQKDYTSKDNYPKELNSDSNYMFNGTVSANQSGVVLTDANFVSLTEALPYERDAAGNIIWGDFLKFIAPIVPAVPANVKATAGDGQVTLSWNTVTGATYYNVYRSDLENGTYVQVGSSVTDATYVNNGLTNGTTYYYQVTAVNPSGESKRSAIVSATPQQSILAPAAPTGLKATGGYYSVSLSWTGSAGASGYHIYQSTAADGAFSKVASTVTEAAYTLTGLNAKTAYYYKVTAWNAAGESDYSAPASAIPSGSNNSGSRGGGGGAGAPSTGNSVETSDGGTKIVGTPVIETVNGKSVATVKLDAAALTKALEAVKNEAAPTIIVEVKTTESVSRVQIPADALAQAAKTAPNAVLSIQTANATYELPLKVLDAAELAKQLGTEAEKVTINVTIEKVSGSALSEITAKAKEAGVTLLSAPIEFTITAEAGNQTIAVSDFGRTYVTRTIVLTQAQTGGFDEISAVMYNPQSGEFSFVPSVFKNAGGVTTAAIKRTGNSTYMVVQAAKTFADLKGHWAQKDAELLASKGLVNGMTATTFAPDNRITRAEFAALLVRAAGLTPQTSSSFSDVKASDWYAGAVGAAAKAGLIDGFENGTFQPNATITREQMAVMIDRTLKFTGKQGNTNTGKLAAFKDSSTISSWAQDAAAGAVNAGIINGLTDTEFAPREQASRAEAAVMLKRLLQFAELMN
ncbi:bacterial Ig-like domain-containing protein [Paenibacillus doosanensis]|uniref:bacterial Ig-like domain-containing protein n=1 Tax=Paenibacillus doosanensis TaxID=1229154 RepID=UPI00217FA91C|nr:bacterial Ig-like domain-containing protein [Paenibacillus doosanensis]MCS7461000.1 bacterial Ig-like domain-containing protein [Paenibacillus doosanensis]